jgi:hypothetical protein
MEPVIFLSHTLSWREHGQIYRHRNFKHESRVLSARKFKTFRGSYGALIFFPSSIIQSFPIELLRK